MGLPLPHLYVESLNSVPQNVTGLGPGAFKGVIKLKWGH